MASRAPLAMHGTGAGAEILPLAPAARACPGLSLGFRYLLHPFRHAAIPPAPILPSTNEVADTAVLSSAYLRRTVARTVLLQRVGSSRKSASSSFRCLTVSTKRSVAIKMVSKSLSRNRSV
jgi:hypothetical protein